MTNEIKDYEGIRIQLLSFDKPTQGTERYYFLEMKTLQATTLISDDRQIVDIKIVAYNDKNNFVNSLTLKSFKTISEFNRFFKANSNYYLHDCDIELEGNLILSSHDNGEVSIQITEKSFDNKIIQDIFNTYKVDIDLISEIRNNPGHYIEIDKNNRIIGNYPTFDDYIDKKTKTTVANN
jgi:hypothetical protein